MGFPWEIVIALAVLVIAYMMKACSHVLEEEHLLYGLLTGFAVLYIASALAIGWLSPALAAKADVRTVIHALVRDSGDGLK
jgi:hypothetical protein